MIQYMIERSCLTFDLLFNISIKGCYKRFVIFLLNLFFCTISRQDSLLCITHTATFQSCWTNFAVKTPADCPSDLYPDRLLERLQFFAKNLRNSNILFLLSTWSFLIFSDLSTFRRTWRGFLSETTTFCVQHQRRFGGNISCVVSRGSFADATKKTRVNQRDILIIARHDSLLRRGLFGNCPVNYVCTTRSQTDHRLPWSADAVGRLDFSASSGYKIVGRGVSGNLNALASPARTRDQF